MFHVNKNEIAWGMDEVREKAYIASFVCTVSEGLLIPTLSLLWILLLDA
jgi:hypothetical protein